MHVIVLESSAYAALDSALVYDVINCGALAESPHHTTQTTPLSVRLGLSIQDNVDQRWGLGMLI